MECVCAPTAKDTVIVLSEHEGQSSIGGYVKVEHDGSSESCSLRNPLQECHVRVMLQRLSGGDVVEESVLFDDTFRSNEKVVDFVFDTVELQPGERLQLRLEFRVTTGEDNHPAPLFPVVDEATPEEPASEPS